MNDNSFSTAARLLTPMLIVAKRKRWRRIVAAIFELWTRWDRRP